MRLILYLFRWKWKAHFFLKKIFLSISNNSETVCVHVFFLWGSTLDVKLISELKIKQSYLLSMLGFSSPAALFRNWKAVHTYTIFSVYAPQQSFRAILQNMYPCINIYDHTIFAHMHSLRTRPQSSGAMRRKMTLINGFAVVSISSYWFHISSDTWKKMVPFRS